MKGWHIKGHEYVDSIIARNSVGTADSIAIDASYINIDTAGHLDTVGTRIDLGRCTYVDVGLFHPRRAGKTVEDTNAVDTSREYMYVLNRRTEPGGERY